MTERSLDRFAGALLSPERVCSAPGWEASTWPGWTGLAGFIDKDPVT